MRSKQKVLISFLCAAASFSLASSAAAVKDVPVQASTRSAVMTFDKTLHDYGSVEQGQQVPASFKFKNTGQGDLILGKLKTSCGCTAATASTGPYRPGEEGSIEVQFDSRGKVGHSQKDVEVFSNDPNSPHRLRMEGTIFEGAHPMKGSADILFVGSCAECHAKPAQGKQGKELYDAVCFMCHDLPQQKGKKAIAGDQEALSFHSKAELKKVITKGLPHTSMPGFGKKAGGPLSKEQIDSLVAFLESIRKK